MCDLTAITEALAEQFRAMGIEADVGGLSGEVRLWVQMSGISRFRAAHVGLYDAEGTLYVCDRHGCTVVEASLGDPEALTVIVTAATELYEDVRARCNP